MIVEEARYQRAFEEAVATRRDLHRHPELGLTEFRTAAIVATRLRELGLEVRLGREVMDEASRVGVPSAAELRAAYERALAEGADPALLRAFEGGFTGVVGTLRGAQAGPVVALRVDMDALPIREDASTGHPPAREGFVSAHDGIMHACGHDTHVAMGLGVAEVLAAARSRIHGSVKLIFQPAEEGGRGAVPMVRAGVVDDVDCFVAIHVGSDGESGTLYPVVTGHLASSKLDVRFRGRAAHAGGRPEEGRNALLAAAQATLGLYAISRHHAGRSRVNVGVLRAGSGRNVIPDEAFCMLEVRGDSEEIADYMLHRAEAVIRGAAAAAEVEVEIETMGRTTTADSDSALAEAIAHAAAGVPSVRVDLRPHQAPGSEDATYFMRRVQERGGLAAYMVVGSGTGGGHHTRTFDIDESTFKGAITVLCEAILSLGAAPPEAGRRRAN
ncbi:MAG: amidohydrolase [bacterium]|nr:amidohydrolase [bacterium]